MTDDKAHARRDDPETSHEAAAAATTRMSENRARVAAYAKAKGEDGFVDIQLSEELEDVGSTYRTRRSELTARNIILDTGNTRRWGDSTRRRIVWVHRDFHPAPPPICEPVDKLKPVEKEDARAKAVLMMRAAPRIRALGMAEVASQIEDAAKLLQRLAA